MYKLFGVINLNFHELQVAKLSIVVPEKTISTGGILSFCKRKSKPAKVNPVTTSLLYKVNGAFAV